MVNAKKIDKVLMYLAEHSIELVSHGLAPNPNGFCYEAPDNTPKSVHEKANKLLNSLSKEEEQHIIVNTF